MTVTWEDIRVRARQTLEAGLPRLRAIANGEPIPQTRVTPAGVVEVAHRPSAREQAQARAALARSESVLRTPAQTIGDIARDVFAKRAVPAPIDPGTAH